MGVVLSFEESHAERASIAPLVEVTAAGLERVNRIIVERTSSDVALIPEVACYLIDSGGKRLRPMVTIASAQACGMKQFMLLTISASRSPKARSSDLWVNRAAENRPSAA